MVPTNWNMKLISWISIDPLRIPTIWCAQHSSSISTASKLHAIDTIWFKEKVHKEFKVLIDKIMSGQQTPLSVGNYILYTWNRCSYYISLSCECKYQIWLNNFLCLKVPFHYMLTCLLNSAFISSEISYMHSIKN